MLCFRRKLCFSMHLHLGRVTHNEFLGCGVPARLSYFFLRTTTCLNSVVGVSKGILPVRYKGILPVRYKGVLPVRYFCSTKSLFNGNQISCR